MRNILSSDLTDGEFGQGVDCLVWFFGKHAETLRLLRLRCNPTGGMFSRGSKLRDFRLELVNGSSKMEGCALHDAVVKPGGVLLITPESL